MPPSKRSNEGVQERVKRQAKIDPVGGDLEIEPVDEEEADDVEEENEAEDGRRGNW